MVVVHELHDKYFSAQLKITKYFPLLSIISDETGTPFFWEGGLISSTVGAESLAPGVSFWLITLYL